MKNAKTWVVLLVLAVVAALLVPSTSAQRRRGPRYDPSAEITVKGRVEEVRTRGPEGRTRTMLVIQTGDKTLNVALGPSSFLAERRFKFMNGDEVEVTGAKVDFRGNQMLLAREIKKGNKTLTLRDAQGRPKWSQEGPRGRQRSTLDSPKFVPATQADFLRDDDRVLGVSGNGVAKAYPVAVLAWHHIVHDRLGDLPILPTW